MLDLEVEVAGEPVVEGALLHVARRLQLHAEPGQPPVLLDLHRDVVRLAHPHEPVALHHPAVCEQSTLFFFFKGSRGYR